MKKMTFSYGWGMSVCYKKMLNPIFKAILFLIITLLPLQKGSAQVEPSSELFRTLKKLDGIIFENGFNKCLLSEMEPFISNDLEFYHDQGGITKTKENFLLTIKENICSNQEQKPIRKLVENSLEVFPLYDKGVLYGALQNGVHEFYIKESGKDLYLTSTAKFSHLWIKETDNWMLKRVLSYDHQTPKVTSKTEIVLSDKILSDYVGHYKSPNIPKITISKKGNGLEMNAGEMNLHILPETEALFFNEQAPLTFEFVKDTDGSIKKMIVREHGKIVEEAIPIREDKMDSN